MRLLIDIPDEQYEYIKKSDKNTFAAVASKECMLHAIKNGISCDTSGDLISRSALKEEISSACYNCASRDEDEYNCKYHCPIYDFLKHIDNAPTVAVNCKDCDGYEAGYSAGLKDAERPQDGWVSVSERLPEDMQRVLIWFEYYRYGDFNCMYQTYGFGYVCDGKWSPFINGETGWQDYRIIAWQPLPEPYEKGGAE